MGRRALARRYWPRRRLGRLGSPSSAYLGLSSSRCLWASARLGYVRHYGKDNAWVAGAAGQSYVYGRGGAVAAAMVVQSHLLIAVSTNIPRVRHVCGVERSQHGRPASPVLL